MEEKFLTIEEVGKELGHHKRTIHSWIKNKNFPSHKIGGGRRFLKSEIDEWLAQDANYDITAGFIMTPFGRGKFISFDGAREKVTVEMDYQYLVEFEAKDCYVEGK